MYILTFFPGCFHCEPLRTGRSERPDMEAAPAFGGGRHEPKGLQGSSDAVRIQEEIFRLFLNLLESV